MSLTTSVVINTTNPFAVHWVVSASGLSTITGSASVTVKRRHLADGSTYEVRGLNQAPVSGDSISSEDYDVPLTKGNWTWDFYVYNASGTVVASATSVSVGAPYQVIQTALSGGATKFSTSIIQSVQQPTLNIPVVVSSFDTFDEAGRVLANLNVLGRKNPVVVSDAFGSKSGQFILLIDPVDLGTGTPTRATHDLLLTYNDTLFFQYFYAGLGMDEMYFKVTDLEYQRLSTAQPYTIGDYLYFPPAGLNVVPKYQVTVSFQEVDRPSTAGETISFSTWNDVKTNFATWNDVLSGRTSWLDVLNRADLP